jgi:hypothetical protein
MPHALPPFSKALQSKMVRDAIILFVAITKLIERVTHPTIISRQFPTPYSLLPTPFN